MTDQNQNQSQQTSNDRVHAAFDFADSDVTLRSSDGVLFRVHKARLASHSLMFKDMFEHAADDAGDVTVGDTADTLAVLLPLCYPSAVGGPPPVDLEALDGEQLIVCYEASFKYDMWLASQLLRRLLLPRIEADPFRAVRVAYVVQDKDMLSKAAEAALQHDLLANAKTKEYREKAGSAWPALLAYYIQYKREVNMFLRVDLSSAYGNGARKIAACGNTLIGQCDREVLLQQARTLKDLSWDQLRWELSDRPGCQLPKANLIAFIETSLDEDRVRRCPGCRSTWMTHRISYTIAIGR